MRYLLVLFLMSISLVGRAQEPTSLLERVYEEQGRLVVELPQFRGSFFLAQTGLDASANDSSARTDLLDRADRLCRLYHRMKASLADTFVPAIDWRDSLLIIGNDSRITAATFLSLSQIQFDGQVREPARAFKSIVCE